MAFRCLFQDLRVNQELSLAGVENAIRQVMHFRANHKDYKAVYHMTFRLAEEFCFAGKLQDCWRAFAASFAQQNFHVHAFVLMENHAHLMISLDNQNIEKIAQHILQTCHFLESQYFFEPILNHSKYRETYRYIYRNPVEVGLCQRAEEYPFSTLKVILGQTAENFPVVDRMKLIANPISSLRWLNQ